MTEQTTPSEKAFGEHSLTQNEKPSKPLETPSALLQRLFGYESFRGQQEEIISHIIAGQDALVLMPTGGGKSLCFQIPALARPGTAIVISPLIALMHDQVITLQQLGINAAYLNSSLDFHEAQKIRAKAYAGELDLLYIAPEGINTSIQLDRFKPADIALFAIDEAHCISQWGHDFRSDYLQLGRIKAQFPEVPCIALTASADTPTQKDIVQQLSIPQCKKFISSFDRPNIFYQITEKTNPKAQLLKFIESNHAGDAGIVYCMTRKKVEDIAAFLCEKGLPALAYHAGLPTEQRLENQNKFLYEDGIIMVATIAFGMGIDKPNVRFVAHMDLPKSIESYYQETGRAGRDSLPANAWMIYGLQDVMILKERMSGSSASQNFIQQEGRRLDTMLGFSETTGCRRKVLLNYFDEASEACGKCDNCQSKPKTWDGTDPARKALSCIYRTGQKFGVNHVIDVLRGKLSDKVTQWNHHQLSTFGIGEDLSINAWRSLIRQLIALGYINIDFDNYGSLRLDASCKPLLQGKQSIAFRSLPEKISTPTKTKSNPAQTLDEPLDQKLWQKLKALRMELAQAEAVPPYVIFSDATLINIIHDKPANRQEFRQVHGIGDTKLERFGDIFLELLQKHLTETAYLETS